MSGREVRRDTSAEPAVSRGAEERPDRAVSVRAFAQKYGAMSRERFLKRYPHPFLVQVSQSDDVGRGDGFFTAAVRDDRAPLNLSLLERGLFYVSKREGTSFKSAISIGRQESCDLTIRSSVVSKSHALLRRRKSQWTIIDSNSRNGTFLKGERLVPARPHRLDPGMRLSLSPDLVLVFMEAAHAFEYVRWVAKKLARLETNEAG